MCVCVCACLCVHCVNVTVIIIAIYSRAMLLGIIFQLYIMHGTNIIKDITMGNSIVQEKDINWSKRILGNEALTQMKTKIITQAFTPRVIPYIRPSGIG